MRRCPLAIEQTRPREEEGAAAHRGHPTRAAGGEPDPVDQLVVEGGRRCAMAAGDHQRVDTASTVVEGVVGDEAQPAGTRQRALPSGDDLDRVAVAAFAAVGYGEDLGRAGDVEDLDIVKGDDDDPAVLPHE